MRHALPKVGRLLSLPRPPVTVQNGGLRVRISEDTRKCVVFLGVRGPNNAILYGGTGFLVYERTASGASLCYLVTARHVANRLDVDFVIRANLAAGGSENIEVETAGWVFPDDKSIDLAVTEFSFPSNKYDHYYHPIANIPIPLKNVMCGDHISIIGLFRLRTGVGKNMPIVHQGHVASLADIQEPIPSRDRTSGQVLSTVAHLVEAQTLNGLSGSPVFIQEYAHFSQFRIQDSISGEQQGNNPLAFGGFKLFGIYQGSWESEPGTILSDDRGFNGEIRVPVGMGLVTPAKQLISLIFEKFQEKRTKVEATVQNINSTISG